MMAAIYATSWILQQLILAETPRQAQKQEVELEWEAPTS